MRDARAGELGIGPVELRLRNFISPSEFPYTNAGKLTYDSGDYARSLHPLVEVAGYKQLREAQSRARGDWKLQGIGIAPSVEIAAGTDSDPAPSRLDSARAMHVIHGPPPQRQSQH